jgi:hypothetical protein
LAPESACTLWSREKSCTAGNGTRAVQPVAIPTEMGSSRNMGKELIHSFSRKSEGKKLLRRPWRRREYNIKIDVKETGLEFVHCIRLD